MPKRRVKQSKSKITNANGGGGAGIAKREAVHQERYNTSKFKKPEQKEKQEKKSERHSLPL